MYIDVVIAAYNAEKYIKESVFSVANQSFKDINIIVVDDCSNDNTYIELCNISSDVEDNINGDFVCLRNERNMGASASRNRGVFETNTKSELLLFHDADDIMTEQSIEKRVGFFDNRNIGVVYGDNYVSDENGENLVYEEKPDFNRKRLIEDNYISCLSMVKKRLFYEVGGFNPLLTYGEDWDLWIKITERSIGLHVHHPCFIYRRVPTSQTSNVDWTTYGLDKNIIFTSLELRMGNKTPEDLLIANNRKITYGDQNGR